jgi:hypothetical protein
MSPIHQVNVASIWNIKSSVDPNDIFRSNNLNSSTLDETQGTPNNFTDPPYNTDSLIFPSSSPSAPVSTSDPSLQGNNFQHVFQVAQANLPSVSHFDTFPPDAGQPTSSTHRRPWAPSGKRENFDNAIARADSTSQVPCKFFLRGTCYAGTGCVFSHEITSTTATDWRYFVPVGSLFY